jgi:hypothetical protein
MKLSKLLHKLYVLRIRIIICLNLVFFNKVIKYFIYNSFFHDLIYLIKKFATNEAYYIIYFENFFNNIFLYHTITNFIISNIIKGFFIIYAHL